MGRQCGWKANAPPTRTKDRIMSSILTLNLEEVVKDRICTYKEYVETAIQILFTALKPRRNATRFLRQIKSEVNRLFE